MFTRRHTYARRALRRTLRRWVGGNLVALAIATAVYFGTMIILTGIMRSEFGRGLVIGGMPVAFLWAMTVVFLVTSGAIYQLGGAWGEDNTREALKRARKRGLVWGSVHNIEVSGVDIDHLVLAPHGALVIDSKWHFSELDARALDRDVSDVLKRAGNAKSVLRSKGIDSVMAVAPVVVVWGRGQRELPDAGIEYRGVPIVAGVDFVKWLEPWRRGPIAQDNAGRILNRLAEFADERRGRTPLREPRPVGSGLRLPSN